MLNPSDTDTDSEEEAPALVAAQHRMWCSLSFIDYFVLEVLASSYVINVVGKGEVKNEKPKPAIDNANAAKIESKPNAKQVELKKVKDEDDDDDEESDEDEDSDDDEVHFCFYEIIYESGHLISFFFECF